jgi:hypothetical protein
MPIRQVRSNETVTAVLGTEGSVIGYELTDLIMTEKRIIVPKKKQAVENTLLRRCRQG